VSLLVLAGTVAALPLLKTNFLGDTGQNTFSVSQSLAPGTSLAAKSAAAEKVEAVLSQVEGIETYQVVIGGSSAIAAFTGSAGADIRYNLTTAAEVEQPEVQAEVRKQLENLDGVGT